jgi:hypothetical protein
MSSERVLPRLFQAICALTLVIFPFSAEAALCYPPKVEAESPYPYLLTLADSFSYANDAIGRGNAPNATDGGDEIFQSLVVFKKVKADFECAASQVAPYAKSSNEYISKSAELIGLTFLTLADYQEEIINDFKVALDAGPAGFKRGTFIERQAQRAASIDDTWKQLVPAAIMATYSVIELDAATGRMSRLALTSKERDEVLRRLRSTFGNDVTKGMKGGQIALVAAAASVYEVIGNQPRKTRDIK